MHCGRKPTFDQDRPIEKTQRLWSSAAAHVAGRDDESVHVASSMKRVKDWREFLADALDRREVGQLWNRGRSRLRRLSFRSAENTACQEQGNSRHAACVTTPGVMDSRQCG